MKIGVVSKIKKSIIIAIAVLLLLLSLVGLFAIIVNRSDKNSTSASYTFTSTTLSDSDYNSNSTFIINNSTGLSYFSGAVNSGKTFSGKTVYLESNLYLRERTGMYELSGIGASTSSSKIIKFCGTFDGKNHYISNFYINAKTFSAVGSGITENYAPCGFFAQLGNGAKVMNLRLEKFNLYCPDVNLIGIPGSFAMGGLVGFIAENDSVSIHNCHINNLSFSKVYTGLNNPCDQKFCGGLVGMSTSNNTNISNCLVSKIKVNFEKSDISMDCYGGLVGNMISGNISKCVHNPTDSNIMSIDFPKNGAQRNNILCSGQGYSIPSSCYSSTSGNFSSLSKSANGGETDGTNYWYYDSSYCSQYSNGFPLLRNSITWKTYTINANEGGSVNKSSLIIPSGFESSLTGKFTDSKYNQQALSVGEQSVVATPTAAYNFSYYSISGTTITANFQRKPVNIRFNITANSHYIVTLNGNNQTSTLSYTVDYGTVITATYSIYQAKYEFTANGNTYSIIYQCNDNRYCIEKSNNQTITVIQETEFEPNFILKEYDVVFR